MTFDISSSVMSAITTVTLGIIIAIISQYFDTKAFKEQTSKELEEIKKRLDAGDKVFLDVKILLTQIKENQVSHEARDEEIFKNISDTLKEISDNFKEIWQKK